MKPWSLRTGIAVWHSRTGRLGRFGLPLATERLVSPSLCHIRPGFAIDRTGQFALVSSLGLPHLLERSGA
jgi:hypothetical protein